LATIYGPDADRAKQWVKGNTHPGKYLLSDGSIVDSSGATVSGPDLDRAQIWEKAPLTINKFLRADGSVED
jgi:hypothetical protein